MNTPTPLPPFGAPADERLSPRSAGGVNLDSQRKGAHPEDVPSGAAPPRLLDRLREAIRVRHYSIRTEDAYADWARRFIVFHDKRHPLDLGAAEVAAFLTYLAVQRNVAASTQNQAKSALLFLYRVVLGDVVAFDEVAGINFKDQDGVQIMKDYMASGSFSRGRKSINASAAMVVVGNLRQGQSVESLVKTSHLFAPFPDVMVDSALFDRFHAYVPGWEIPKMRPEFFTDQYGLIVDYLAEWAREMRKRSFADSIDKHFKLGNNLNQRDTIAVRRTVSGLLKLICPDAGYTKETVRKCLEYALEVRRRLKVLAPTPE